MMGCVRLYVWMIADANSLLNFTAGSRVVDEPFRKDTRYAVLNQINRPVSHPPPRFCYNSAMKRILLLCRRDWLTFKSDRSAQYTYEIFSRIAAQGHYIAWVAHRPISLLRKQKPSRVEVVENIQVARLGPEMFYSRMVSMLLNKLQSSKGIASHYDVVIDCVQKRPLPLWDQVDIPILPLIFGLSRWIHGSDEAPGPVIATTPSIRKQLETAGFPDNLLINAFFPEAPPPGTHDDEQPSWDHTAYRVLSVIENL